MDQARNLSNLLSKLITPQEASSSQGLVDKRQIDRALKHINRTMKLAADPKLRLNTSPPCLTDILPNIASNLRSCSDQLATYDDNALHYLKVFCESLVTKLKLFAELVRHPQMYQCYDDNSPRRKVLTVLTLRLSHVLQEIKALFPDGSYAGDGYKITKEDAAEFWTSKFGGSILVPWEQFQSEFSSVHPLKSRLEVAALKTTIDLTGDEQVSIFEFDVFVRLFHPWKSILKNWNLLAISHPGYVAFLTYDEVKARLQKFIDKPGSYVFRQSCTRPGQWAIGYVTNDKRILQTIPQSRSLVQALVDGQRDEFYKYPDGLNILIDLSSALEESSCEQINVTQEQYEMYCRMGDLFEICKICSENEKDTCIEPCKHLICADCLKGWLNKNGKTCPFCREEIKGHHSVKIEQYGSEHQEDHTVSSDVKLASNGELESQMPGQSTRSDELSKYSEEQVMHAMALANENLELALEILKLCDEFNRQRSF